MTVYHSSIPSYQSGSWRSRSMHRVSSKACRPFIRANSSAFITATTMRFVSSSECPSRRSRSTVSRATKVVRRSGSCLSEDPVKSEPKPHRKRTCSKCSNRPDRIECPRGAQQSNKSPNKCSEDNAGESGNSADTKEQSTPTSDSTLST